MADLRIRALWQGAEAKAGVQDLSGAITALKGVAAGLGIAFGLSQIAAEMKAVVVDTAAEQQGLARLSVSLKNVGESSQSIRALNGYISDLQDTTQFADDAIAAALTRMAQATGNAAASAANLSLAMELATGTGKSLEESGQIVAMAMQGQVRAVGQLLPHLKTYMENLEGTEDPAQRSALAMQALRDAFSDAAAADLATYNGQLAALNNQLGELGNTVANRSGILGFLAELTQGTRVWVLAMREGITLAEAMARISNPQIPGLGGGVPLVNGGMPVATPSGSNPNGGSGASPNVVGFSPGAFSPFGFRQLGGMRGGSGEIPGLRDLGSMPAEELERARKDMLESIRKFSEEAKQPMREVGAELKAAFMGAFDSLRNGWRGLVDFMKDYLSRVLIEYAAGSLVNALLPGAGVGVGILGRVTGGAGNFQAASARDFSMSMRQMRLA